jgi:hypothetical protein
MRSFLLAAVAVADVVVVAVVVVVFVVGFVVVFVQGWCGLLFVAGRLPGVHPAGTHGVQACPLGRVHQGQRCACALVVSVVHARVVGTFL